MQIQVAAESASTFIERAWKAMGDAGTHVYFDTSFLMWLTTIGPKSRQEFTEWAATLDGRIHVPVWAIHEYYKHHTRGTLRDGLDKCIFNASNAATEFVSHIWPFTDQPLQPSRTEAEYRAALRQAVARLGILVNAAKTWNYGENAKEVISWMNAKACPSEGAFDEFSVLHTVGATRYIQNVPPGFEDRHKKSTEDAGGNLYGDLLFWDEIVRHTRTCGATTAIIVSNDRKRDWYFRVADAEVETDLKRLRPRWDPVPAPHPTLAFEIRDKAKVQNLILLDGLYLGAVLWKKDRALFGRFADAAIGGTPSIGRGDERPAAPVVKRSMKRSGQASIGALAAKELINKAIAEPDAAVQQLLAQLVADPPDRDAFLDSFVSEALPKLDKPQIATFARVLHDRALDNVIAAESLATALIDRLDQLSPDEAACLYLGFALSAYMEGRSPRPRPRSPFLEQLFYWQDDPALSKVLRALDMHLDTIKSPALYRPNAANTRVPMIIEHDATTRQIPAELVQVALAGKNLLVDGELRLELSLRQGLNGQAEATLHDIARAVCVYYGAPLDLVDIEGGELDEARSIPELLGFREFDRFEEASAETPDDQTPLPSPDDIDDIDDLELDKQDDQTAGDADEDEGT